MAPSSRSRACESRQSTAPSWFVNCLPEDLEFAMRTTGFAVVLLAAAQPSQAYLMGRAGLPFTNAAFREVASQAIQTSVCTTILPTAVAASIPETLRSLQTPASIGGMVSTFDKLGRCVDECQRDGIDLSCAGVTLLAPPDTALHKDDDAEVRTPITGEVLRHRSWSEVAPRRDDDSATSARLDDPKPQRVHTQEHSSGRPGASGGAVQPASERRGVAPPTPVLFLPHPVLFQRTGRLHQSESCRGLGSLRPRPCGRERLRRLLRRWEAGQAGGREAARAVRRQEGGRRQVAGARRREGVRRGACRHQGAVVRRREVGRLAWAAVRLAWAGHQAGVDRLAWVGRPAWEVGRRAWAEAAHQAGCRRREVQLTLTRTRTQTLTLTLALTLTLTLTLTVIRWSTGHGQRRSAWRYAAAGRWPTWHG